MAMLKTLLRGLTDLFYPHNCILCRKYLAVQGKTSALCEGCLNSIESNRPPFCPKCSRHLSDIQNLFCRDCLKTELHFDQAWGACLYGGPMRQIIHLFKYSSKTSLKHHFTELIFSFLENYQIDLKSFEMVIPVPLHPVRMRERTYNQAQILSEEISQKLGVIHTPDNLIRIRPTQNQALLDKKDRWTNIHGAFRIKNSRQFSKRSVLIVDDLLTTGITASEIAGLLKEAGAKTVGVLTLAITP